MNINYVLTTFSPAMFGEGANASIRMIDADKARSLISSTTKIVATRVSHDRLARDCFPNADPETARYAALRPGVNAIHLQYRGPQVPDTGVVPAGGLVTFFLIEVTELQGE